MKIPSVGAELFSTSGQTDRRTDMTKLTVAFRNFANALQKSSHHPILKLNTTGKGSRGYQHLVCAWAAQNEVRWCH